MADAIPVNGPEEAPTGISPDVQAELKAQGGKGSKKTQTEAPKGVKLNSHDAVRVDN